MKKARRLLILFILLAFCALICTGFYFADTNIKSQSGFLKSEVLLSADIGWGGNLAITVMGEVRTIEISGITGHAKRAIDNALLVFSHR